MNIWLNRHVFLALSTTCNTVISNEDELSHLSQSITYAFKFPKSLVNFINIFLLYLIPDISDI